LVTGGGIMSAILEARGLSCQDVFLLVIHAIKKANEGEIVILVNKVNAREGISRGILNQGWRIKSIESHGSSLTITISNEWHFNFL
jgi:TusA-related sulfurtransferase